ncbi:MAG: hypothetical protein ACM3XS_06725 [Bacteroidota bacterium]
MFLVVLGLFLAERTALAAPVTDAVDAVSAVVESAAPLPAPLQDKLEESVTRVAERILLGRTVSSVAENRGEYERIIREVFGRILVGYRIEQLLVNAGTETRVVLGLAPEGRTIGRLSLDLRASGLPDAAGGLLVQDTEIIQQRLGSLFLGVPVEALAWAQPILTPAVLGAVQEELPGFRVALEVVPGEELTLRLGLTPEAATVQSVVLQITSATLPRLVTGMWRERAAAVLSSLPGLPLAYVRRRQLAMEEAAARALSEDPFSIRAGLHWTLRLVPGPVTLAKFAVDADRYSLTLQGRMEVRETPVFGLHLGAGFHPLPGWEIFAGVALDTSGLGMELDTGVIWKLSPELALGLTQSTRAAERRAWLRFASGEGDLFVLGGDLDTGELAATVGLWVENQLLVALTVESDRRYSLLTELSL